MDKQVAGLKKHVDKRFAKLDRKIEGFRKKLYAVERRKKPTEKPKYALKPFDSWKENDAPETKWASGLYLSNTSR